MTNVSKFPWFWIILFLDWLQGTVTPISGLEFFILIMSSYFCNKTVLDCDLLLLDNVPKGLFNSKSLFSEPYVIDVAIQN